MGNLLLTREFRAMGTTISIDIALDSGQEKTQAELALIGAGNIFFEKEKVFSRFQATSELVQLNNNLDKELPASAEMLEVLRLCLQYYQRSTGYFDPRIIENLEKIGYDRDFRRNDLNEEVGTLEVLQKVVGKLEQDLILDENKKTVWLKKRIDVAGVVKGWTVDRVADYLKAQGFCNFIVEAGGDMFAAGRNAEGESWRIGIEGVPDGKLMLKLNQAGIATSGISNRRWSVGAHKVHHLINPKDPANFATDIKTVTVIGQTAVEADGKAKVLFLMGRMAGLRFAEERNIKALFLDYKGAIYLSSAIKDELIN